jgi:transposase
VLDVEQWAELRREHFVRGVSIKELMRRTGLARNTIRVALRSDAPPGFRCPERPSKLDPFKEEICELLRSDPKLSGVRVRELIEPLGYAGGKSIVDDYLECPRFCGHLSAWVCRPGQEGCGVDATQSSPVPGGVPS